MSDDQEKPGGERADEISQQALRLFLERGFDNTPMSLIAKELGLTKAGLYHHFESKEHLLYVTHKNTIERQLLPVIAAAEAEPEGDARLRSFMIGYAMLLARDPSTRVLIHEARRLEPAHFAEIQGVWRQGFELVRGAIRELQAQGRCGPGVNPTYAAFAAIGMCSWILYWFDPRRPDTAEAVAASMADIFLNGILARD